MYTEYIFLIYIIILHVLGLIILASYGLVAGFHTYKSTQEMVIDNPKKIASRKIETQVKLVALKKLSKSARFNIIYKIRVDTLVAPLTNQKLTLKKK